MALNTILSLGAGVQSSTLLLMAVQGEIGIDAAIFADTGWEPPAVYEWLTYLKGEAAEAGIPVHRVASGNLRADALSGQSSAWMPLFVRNLDGGEGMLRRQCTSNYKIAPIRRELRAQGFSRSHPVRLIIGISLDEAHRMRDSDVQYIEHVYPLVDQRLRRTDCLTWLTSHGYPSPAKSSCIGCPYHGDAYWRDLRDHHPEGWADAVEFDAGMRHFRDGCASAFLHRQRVPLAEVDLRTEQDRGQLDLFGDECEGVCGV